MREARLESLLLSPWVLGLAVASSFFATLGGLPLFDLDEGAFTEATREMLASGNFLATYLDGRPRFDKPVLTYWLQAASASLFGFNEFALRLPSALASTAWALCLFRFARQFIDRVSAAVAMLVMVTTLAVTIIGKAAIADALLNLWLALAMFDIYRYSQQPAQALVLRVYLWMGLGLLTKGPVAVFFPLVVSSLYFLSRGEFADYRRAIISPAGWLVLLVVALPGYLAAYIDQGNAFLEGFFLHHNLGRFSSTMQSHGGNITYYLLSLPLSLLPFTGWFLRVIGRWRKALTDTLDRFLWLWFLSVFVFFSLSQTQLPHYLLYGCTPLFILMAKYRETLVRRWQAFLPPVLLLIALLCLPLFMELAIPHTRRAYERELLQHGLAAFSFAYYAVTAAALALTLLLWFRSRATPWQGLLAVGLAVMVVVNAALLPAAATVQQMPVREAARMAQGFDRPVVAYRISMPSFSVYRDAITPRRAPQAGDLVFTRLDHLSGLSEGRSDLRLTVVYRRGGIVLLTADAADD
jgi:4-amino-4-deoxy-L-arabinose transferase-like glycosyltransferase